MTYTDQSQYYGWDMYGRRVVYDPTVRVRDLEQAVRDYENGLLTKEELVDLAKPCVFR